jgi:hypothetical protein
MRRSGEPFSLHGGREVAGRSASAHLQFANNEQRECVYETVMITAALTLVPSLLVYIADITEFPAPAAVTTPVEETVATAELLVLHVQEGAIFELVPSAVVAIASKARVPPTAPIVIVFEASVSRQNPAYWPKHRKIPRHIQSSLLIHWCLNHC